MIFAFMVPLTFMASLIGVFFYMALVKRPKNLTKAFIKFYKPFIFEPKRWAKAVPAIGVMMLGFMAFTEMKSVIPLLNPYSWDLAFVELDRLLHFGQDPWIFLQPRIHKNFGRVMLAFLMCIIIGSVHLAWHYAVDAYAGIIIAFVIWKASGAILKWQDKALGPQRD